MCVAFDTADGGHVASSRFRDGSTTDRDRNYGIAMHLTPLAGLVAAPLVLLPVLLWALRKDESAYVNDHGREITNALLSFFLYHVVAVITVIGILALPVLYIVGVISMIRGAAACSRGEYFRYPMTIRFLK